MVFVKLKRWSSDFPPHRGRIAAQSEKGDENSPAVMSNHDTPERALQVMLQWHIDGLSAHLRRW